MNVLSLFAGIGGIDLGLERLGCTTVAHSEIDEYASDVFARHFPDSQAVGDITDLTFERNENGTTYIERGSDGEGWWLPPIDIIAGGFPCQDISLAGKGAGIKEGTRSGLWTHYARAIRDLRPRGVLVENVASLASRGLDRVLGDLAACGYDAEWDCIPARAVGAPHLRDRMFVVAYPEGSGGEGSRAARLEVPQLPAQETVSGRGSSGAGGSHWIPEPIVARLVDGVPSRMEWAQQLAVIGNAVVPQVAEHVGRILLERMGVEALIALPEGDA